MSRFFLALGFAAAVSVASLESSVLAQDDATNGVTPTLKPTTTVDVEEPQDPETLASKASYILGYNTARRMVADLSTQGVDVDQQQMLKGIQDSLGGKQIAYQPEEIRSILTAFQKMMQEKQVAKMSRLSAENQAAGEAFRNENGAKEGVKTLDNGIQYEVLTAGDGPLPAETAKVKIDYKGMFVDGTVFDSSLEPKQGRPAQPMEVAVSGVGMIKAFGVVLPMMNVGSKWKVVIPPALAYQVRGQGPIGPNETLIFEIEMKEIVPAPAE